MTALALGKLEAGGSLSRVEADALMEELLAGRMAHEDIVRLLLALRAKGETVEELVGFARAMRRRTQPIVIGECRRGGRGRHFGGRISAGGYVRNGRRRVGDVQCFDGGGAGGGRRGSARGQARQPLAQFALRLGRRAGSAGRENQYAGGAGGRSYRSRSASRFFLRRRCTRRCGTPWRRGAKSADVRCSTCSGRWPIPRALRCR